MHDCLYKLKQASTDIPKHMKAIAHCCSDLNPQQEKKKKRKALNQCCDTFDNAWNGIFFSFMIH